VTDFDNPTAFLDAISPDAPAVIDDDLEPWEAERQGILAELADELGLAAWHDMVEQADRGKVDPRCVLRATKADSLPEETLTLDGANVAAHLPFVLPAWEERHGAHPWYEPPRSVRSPLTSGRCALARRPRRRETRSQSRHGRRSARARSPGRPDRPDDDPRPPDAPPKGAA
jgi:hypothetical protein